MASDPPPLPGQRARRHDVRAYLVVPTKEALRRPDHIRGRRAISEYNLRMADKLAADILRLAEESGNAEAIDGPLKPMNFGTVILTCTPELAKSILELPDVEAVIDDTKGMSMY